MENISIEVQEPTERERAYFHSVIIEDEVTPDVQESIWIALETHPDVSVCFSPIRPGEEIAEGVTAEHTQFIFYARRDMRGDLPDILTDAELDAAKP